MTIILHLTCSILHTLHLFWTENKKLQEFSTVSDYHKCFSLCPYNLLYICFYQITRPVQYRSIYCILMQNLRTLLLSTHYYYYPMYNTLWSLQTYTPLVFLIFFNLTLIIIQCYSLFSIFFGFDFFHVEIFCFHVCHPTNLMAFFVVPYKFHIFCINTSVLTYSCEKKNIHTGQSKPLIILCRKKKLIWFFVPSIFVHFFSFYSCSYSLFTWFFEHTYYNVPGPTWESVQDFLISLAMKCLRDLFYIINIYHHTRPQNLQQGLRSFPKLEFQKWIVLNIFEKMEWILLF